MSPKRSGAPESVAWSPWSRSSPTAGTRIRELWLPSGLRLSFTGLQALNLIEKHLTH